MGGMAQVRFSMIPQFDCFVRRIHTLRLLGHDDLSQDVHGVWSV
jgi:hypothetical protein